LADIFVQLSFRESP